MQVIQSDENLIRKVNHLLSPALKGQAIMLRFKEPVLLTELQNLLRIKLYRDMLATGEDDFHYIGVEDETAWRARLDCMVCRVPLSRWKERDHYICKNAACEMVERPILKCRGQGISKLRFSRSMVAEYKEENVLVDLSGGVFDRPNPDRATVTVARTPKLLMVVVLLDRRYGDNVLAAMYRSAGAVADMMGWQLAN